MVPFYLFSREILICLYFTQFIVSIPDRKIPMLFNLSDLYKKYNSRKGVIVVLPHWQQRYYHCQINSSKIIQTSERARTAVWLFDEILSVGPTNKRFKKQLAPLSSWTSRRTATRNVCQLVRWHLRPSSRSRHVRERSLLLCHIALHTSHATQILTNFLKLHTQAALCWHCLVQCKKNEAANPYIQEVETSKCLTFFVWKMI